MSDPKRLLDDAGDSELKALVSAGKSELPSERALGALAAKLGIAAVLGGAAASSAAGSATAGAGGKLGAAAATIKAATATKLVVAVAVVAAAGVGTVAIGTHEQSDVRPPMVGVVASASTVVPASPSDLRSATTTAHASSAPQPPASAQSSARAVPPSAGPSAVRADDELKLLTRAQDALQAGRPADALASCDEHARTFPSGMLAQEREVIAIEALVHGGRMAEAQARADRFNARFPRSSHARRVETILGR